jgi:hypothetical protein
MAYKNPTAGAAREDLNAGEVTFATTELNDLAAAIPTSAVADLDAYVAGTTTTAVPGSFADEAAVQTYLVTLRAEIEARLDAIDAQTALEVTEINALLAVLRTAGIVTP